MRSLWTRDCAGRQRCLLSQCILGVVPSGSWGCYFFFLLSDSRSAFVLRKRGILNMESSVLVPRTRIQVVFADREVFVMVAFFTLGLCVEEVRCLG